MRLPVAVRLLATVAAVASAAVALADEVSPRYADVKKGQTYVVKTSTSMVVEGAKLTSDATQETHIDAVDRDKGTMTYTVTNTVTSPLASPPSAPTTFGPTTVPITGVDHAATPDDGQKPEIVDLQVKCLDKDVTLHCAHAKKVQEGSTTESWTSTETHPIDVKCGDKAVTYDCHFTRTVTEMPEPSSPDHPIETTVEAWTADRYPSMILEHVKVDGSTTPSETTAQLVEIKEGS